MIIKKNRFSVLEILEIHQQINRESGQQYTKYNNRHTTNLKKETSNGNERQSNNNTTLKYHIGQTVIQEEMNIEIIKRIISEKKTVLTSQRNRH